MEGSVYLLNGFSPNMLRAMFNEYGSSIIVPFTMVDLDRVRSYLSSHRFVSAIGHESTARLLSSLLELDIPANRINVNLGSGDGGFIVTLGFRPEEGRVYSYDELVDMYNNGLIMFTEFLVPDYTIDVMGYATVYQLQLR